MKGGDALLGAGGRVLVVDDQETNRELVEEILTAAGYEVELAVDGQDALDRIEAVLPECIVLDVMMPRLDGFEVCRRLRSAPRTRFIPIVMLTALSETRDKVRGLESGADDFLNKPVRREELLARVQSLVRIRRLREELDTAEALIFTMVRALESKDPRATGHSERVAAMAMATAAALGLTAREFEAVGKGALLHDIGRLGVPEAVLQAERPLAGDALAAYRQHPATGERILQPLRSLGAGLDVVRHHHERIDGSGYPDGLSGASFTVPAQLVAIANVYDDVATDSSSAAAAAEALRAEAAAGRFRGDLVDAFLRTGPAAFGRGGEALSDPWMDLAPPHASEPGGRVLVCDDTAANREMLQAVLEEAGYTVVAESDGSAAVHAIEEYRPDLVILDIRMPGLDGFEVCEWIKRSPETEFLPVVLVTAFGDHADRAHSARVGADDFLTLPVNRLELLARVRSLRRLRAYHDDLEDHQSVVLSLASVLEAKDPYTRGHSARVGELAARLALQMGLPAALSEQLKIAGLLHDIGKVGVPERLINKPGRLTDEEFLTIMSHPGGGATMVRPLRTVRDVLPVIRHHHERWDGHGYPDKLRGEEIPLGARVLAIADAFDALTSDRSYRKALAAEEAIATLARETVEGKWDPATYAALSAMVRRGAHII
ncbi:MAG: response regulator [Vicinamibacteria bacterium]|nr:response regulator [Vicinamibacteria bacterium]